MRVIIRDNKETAAEYVAQYVKNAINKFGPTEEKPFVLGLPTGSTPIAVYKKLVDFYKNGELSFEHVVTFNMDEYVGLDRQSPFSYHSFMWDHLFKHVNIQPQNANILNGEAEDLVAECNAYEEKIKKYGGIKLFLAGLGADGHIAFNEPGSSLASRTRIKTLAYDTIQINAQHFGGNIDLVPRMSLTVGVGTVLDAEEVLCMVTGSSKAHAFMKCIEEGVSHMYTMSALQMHQNALIVCDEDATLECRVRTIKYFKELEQTQRLVQEEQAKKAQQKQ